MKRITLALAALTLFASACDRQPGLETRTFAVHHLAPHEVEALIAPYVFTDRPDHPGMLSSGPRAVTVRETADNLDKIERVLAQYDDARPDMRLTFQVIEADGFTESDPKIADVEAQLRKLFQFKGYRLAAEGVVTVTDGGKIQQALVGDSGRYMVDGTIYWTTGGSASLQEMRLWTTDHDVPLQTSVTIQAGQTLVLGSTPKAGSSATLFLTVHAEDVEPSTGG